MTKLDPLTEELKIEEATLDHYFPKLEAEGKRANGERGDALILFATALDLTDKAIKRLKQKVKTDLLAVADAGEYEDLRREVEKYFGDEPDKKIEERKSQCNDCYDGDHCQGKVAGGNFLCCPKK